LVEQKDSAHNPFSVRVIGKSGAQKLPCQRGWIAGANCAGSHRTDFGNVWNEMAQ
jgi:hypothetical protein